jgi:hypothetical protein
LAALPEADPPFADNFPMVAEIFWIGVLTRILAKYANLAAWLNEAVS